MRKYIKAKEKINTVEIKDEFGARLDIDKIVDWEMWTMEDGRKLIFDECSRKF